MELIDLVNFVKSKMTLLKWLTFLFGSLTVSLTSPALLDLFISSDTSICSRMAFPPFWSYDHVVHSVSMDFSSNSKQDALFHCVAWLFLCWSGQSLWLFKRCSGKILLNFLPLLLVANFVSGFRLLELMYVSPIISITHFHGFQMLVMLP